MKHQSIKQISAIRTTKSNDISNYSKLNHSSALRRPFESWNDSWKLLQNILHTTSWICFGEKHKRRNVHCTMQNGHIHDETDSWDWYHKLFQNWSAANPATKSWPHSKFENFRRKHQKIHEKRRALHKQRMDAAGGKWNELRFWTKSKIPPTENEPSWGNSGKLKDTSDS